METLEELQAILDDAKEFNKTARQRVKGIKIFDGWYRWFLDDNNYSKIFDDIKYDNITQIERSLADIQRIVDFMKLINHFNKSLDKVAAHIQKSQPSFCMGGVDSDDEFSSASKIVGYIESLEGK